MLNNVQAIESVFCPWLLKSTCSYCTFIQACWGTGFFSFTGASSILNQSLQFCLYMKPRDGSRPTYETCRSRSDFQGKSGKPFILRKNENNKNVPNFCLVSVVLHRLHAPTNFVDSRPRDAPDDCRIRFAAQPCWICLVVVCTQNKIQFNLCLLERLCCLCNTFQRDCFVLYVKQ